MGRNQASALTPEALFTRFPVVSHLKPLRAIFGDILSGFRDKNGLRCAKQDMSVRPAERDRRVSVYEEAPGFHVAPLQCEPPCHAATGMPHSCTDPVGDHSVLPPAARAADLGFRVQGLGWPPSCRRYLRIRAGLNEAPFRC